MYCKISTYSTVTLNHGTVRYDNEDTHCTYRYFSVSIKSAEMPFLATMQIDMN